MPEPCFSDLAQERISTSRGSLMAAFAHVIETAGRRQVTDLHVRRLLCYVRAHDRYYTGVPKSLAQLARMLVLSITTCRRVIARAVEEFNLLIVIPQRNYPGGQTVNRYTINWDNVDAILYDIEIADCAAADDANIDSTPLSNNMPVRLAPSTRNDLADLILEDRILNAHPRILRLPKRLLNSLTLKDWPYTVRRAPRETPKDLLAHFDVLLTKLQTAIDRAKQLGATKIEDRLVTLWHKLSAVHYRASHAALCRTNLPPLNPPPERSLNAQLWSDFDFDAFNSRVTATYAQMRDRLSRSCDDLAPVALSDQPPALSDHAPSDLPGSSYSQNAYRLQPNSPVRLAPSDFESLMIALDELIAALSAATQSASDYGITWLQNRFTTHRRRIKAIRAKANALTEVHSLTHDDQSPPYSLN